MMRSPEWCARVFGQGVEQVGCLLGELKRFEVQHVQQVCLVAYMRAVLPK